MKLSINNLDLGYTIDTYGTFTGERIEESEVDYYNDEYGISPDKIEFEYNHPGVVNDLAIKSINILEHNLKGDIVKSIKLVKTTSPQFYNYTTDSYVAEWDINYKKLREYIAKSGLFYAWYRENWDYLNIEFESEDYIVAMLDFYTRNEYEPEGYENDMFEYEWEAWSNNMKPTKEFQKIVDKALAKEARK